MGKATFILTSRSIDIPGAMYLDYSNVGITGYKTLDYELSGNEGGLYAEAGEAYTYNWSVAFVENSAGGIGGAMVVLGADIVEVSDAMFKSNEAPLGGAVYVTAVEDRHTNFSACIFEGNRAADGGAVYLYTGPGVDIFTESVFRNNFARTSGGAMFHTGHMRVFNSSFVANLAGIEGAAVMSLGFLDELSNVSFSENAYYCSAGEYGYIVKNEIDFDFCLSCFDEVCSRCSTGANGVKTREEVRIDGLPVCAEPPAGAVAPSSGTTTASLTLEPGYFRTSNQSHVVLKCYQESACRGGNDASKYCTSGYTGPYCAVCAEGFAPGNTYSCRQCSGSITRSAVGLTVAMGLAVLLFAAFLLSHLGSVVRDGAEEGVEIAQSSWKQKCWSCRASLVKMLPLAAIKIVVTVWQIISQFGAIAGDIYPELYKTFISKLNPINIDFVFSYSCLVTNDFYVRLLFATIMPIVVLVVLAGSHYIGMNRNSSSESAMRQVRHKHQAAVLYVAFIVYSPVSYRIFQMFDCDELDDGDTYLRADYSLSCSTSRHSWYETYALIMVGVYPIGVAAAVLGLLVWHRRDLAKPDRGTMLHLKPFNGVWAVYRPSRYYYEVVECIRRIALTGIAAFVLPNSTAQVSIALLSAVGFVFVSETLSPFQKSADMGLYRWGNGIIVASLYVAFLMKVDVGRDTTQYLLTFSGVLIAANAFMAVAVLVQTALLVKELRGMKEAVRMVDVPVRRTASGSVRDASSLNERAVGGEGDVDIEFKDSET